MTNYRVTFHEAETFLSRKVITFDPMPLKTGELKRSLKEVGLNEKQIDTVIRHVTINHENRMLAGGYEIKRIRINRFGEEASLFLNYTVGLKNDEGTLAETLARTSSHLAIGARGGLEAHDGMDWVKGRDAWATTETR